LIVAALIAALGTSMVFLYVRGADNRAQAAQDPVQVLKAIAVINPGETLLAAQTAGKIELGTVPTEQVLSGAVNSTSTIGDQVALSTIYPNEQIISAKFGAPGDQKVLTIPDGQIAISINLTDTGRVAGFVSPGAEVAIFLSSEAEGVRLLLPRVPIIAVGSPCHHRRCGGSDDRTAATHPLHPCRRSERGGADHVRGRCRRADIRIADGRVHREDRTGHHRHRSVPVNLDAHHR